LHRTPAENAALLSELIASCYSRPVHGRSFDSRQRRDFIFARDAVAWEYMKAPGTN
jgi:hypothetical protein